MNGKFILIASYPKSGNTWFRAVLTSYGAGGSQFDLNRLRFINCADRSMFDRLLGVRSADLTARETARVRPLVYSAALVQASGDIPLKVHDAWMPTMPRTPLPFAPDSVRAAIYIVRDPRDVALSLANHMGVETERAISIMGSQDFVLGVHDRHLSPQLPQKLSTWSRHVKSWTGANQIRVLTVRYEDLLTATEQTIRRAFDFLEIAVIDEFVKQAVLDTTFEKLKREEQERGFRERSPASTGFFRSGQSGGWREKLSARQVEQIHNDHGPTMAAQGYL